MASLAFAAFMRRLGHFVELKIPESSESDKDVDRITLYAREASRNCTQMGYQQHINSVYSTIDREFEVSFI